VCLLDLVLLISITTHDEISIPMMYLFFCVLLIDALWEGSSFKKQASSFFYFPVGGLLGWMGDFELVLVWGIGQGCNYLPCFFGLR